MRDLAILELLEAAHIVAKQFDGCDDALNGLVLCRNHHAAFDRRLVQIDPQTFDLIAASGQSSESLRMTRGSIAHLSQLPAPEALELAFSGSAADGD